MMEDLVDYVEHAFNHVSTLRVVLMDDEWFTEEIRYEFNEDGATCFEDTVSFLQDFLDPEELTFVF